MLFQLKYAGEVISKARLIDEYDVDTPLELNLKLKPTKGKSLYLQGLYQTAWNSHKGY